VFCVLDEVSSLYSLAGVEYAVLTTRHWLNLLDLSDLDILEFALDLKVCLIFDSVYCKNNTGRSFFVVKATSLKPAKYYNFMCIFNAQML